MFEWLIKTMFKWGINAAEWFIDQVVGTFGFDLIDFTNNLPLTRLSYPIFQSMAVGMVMLFLLWQCLKAFGAPIGIESDDPIRVFFKSALAMFCIYHAQELFNLGFMILRPIYDNFLNIDATAVTNTGEIKAVDALSAITDTTTGLLSGDLDLATLIVYGVLFLIILYYVIKMVLEITERYILMGILAVTSPLGFATMTTKSTSNIFSAWLRMVMGQFVTYLLNIWVLKMFLNGFANMESLKNLDGSGIVNLIFMWAFLKVAQRLDTYLGKLGIEVGNVGGSLVEEMVVARMGIGLLTGKGNGGGGLIGALKGKSSGGGLASALKSATGGGAAAATVVGEAAAATGLFGKVANFAKSTYNKSPMHAAGKIGRGVLSYYGKGGEGRQAFTDAKARAKANGNGETLSTIKGARSAAWSGFKEAIGYNAYEKAKYYGGVGKNIAEKMNAGVPKEEASVSGLERDLLQNPAVASSTLNNLQQPTTGRPAESVIKGFVQDEFNKGKENVGYLDANMINGSGHFHGQFNAELFNGGAKWTLDEPIMDGSGEQIATTNYEGYFAIEGNNNAMKQVENMKSKNSDCAYGVIDKGQYKIHYASIRKETPINKFQQKNKT